MIGRYRKIQRDIERYIYRDIERYRKSKCKYLQMVLIQPQGLNNNCEQMMVLSRFQLGFNRSRKSWSVVSGHLLPGFSEAKGCCGEAHQTGATCEVTKVTEVTGVTKAKMWISTLGNGNIGRPKQTLWSSPLADLTLWSSPLADLDVSKAWLKPFDPALHSSCVFVNHTRPCDILWSFHRAKISSTHQDVLLE